MFINKNLFDFNTVKLGNCETVKLSTDQLVKVEFTFFYIKTFDNNDKF